jgi:NAD-dependent DNA ligase
VLDAPVISDLEFDKLLNELKQIEAEHPDWVTADSPTLRAGASPADRFVKVNHLAPILSLGNTFGADDARGWFERLSRIDDRVESARFVVERAPLHNFDYITEKDIRVGDRVPVKRAPRMVGLPDPLSRRDLRVSHRAL